MQRVLLCSALYAKCPYYVVFLYAKCPYYVVFLYAKWPGSAPPGVRGVEMRQAQRLKESQQRWIPCGVRARHGCPLLQVEPPDAPRSDSSKYACVCIFCISSTRVLQLLVCKPRWKVYRLAQSPCLCWRASFAVERSTTLSTTFLLVTPVACQVTYPCQVMDYPATTRI